MEALDTDTEAVTHKMWRVAWISCLLATCAGVLVTIFPSSCLARDIRDADVIAVVEVVSVEWTRRGGWIRGELPGRAIMCVKECIKGRVESSRIVVLYGLPDDIACYDGLEAYTKGERWVIPLKRLKLRHYKTWLQASFRATPSNIAEIRKLVNKRR